MRKWADAFFGKMTTSERSRRQGQKPEPEHPAKALNFIWSVRERELIYQDNNPSRSRLLESEFGNCTEDKGRFGLTGTERLSQNLLRNTAAL